MVTGYTPDTVYISDNGRYYERTLPVFLASWAALGNMAIVAGKLIEYHSTFLNKNSAPVFTASAELFFLARCAGLGAFLPGIQVFHLFVGEGINDDTHGEQFQAGNLVIDLFRNGVNSILQFGMVFST